MKYYANWSANNGTRNMEPVEFSNREKALKWARECALAERQLGNKARWTVIDEDGRDVYIGEYIPNVGVRMRVKKYKTVI